MFFIGAARLPKSAGVKNLGDWENLLHDVIAHDALGVDRIDYLLRDSLHTGVAYGRFDHLRLVDTIRILPRSSSSDSVALGLEQGGAHTAEALLLARYFMFMQVYNHPVRKAYDLHLQDFIRGAVGRLQAGLSWDSLRGFTDTHLMSKVRRAARNSNAHGHDAARRIVDRDHFRRVYEVTPAQVYAGDDLFDEVKQALSKALGDAEIKEYSRLGEGRPIVEFPIEMSDGAIRSPGSVSETFARLPISEVAYLFVDKSVREAAASVVRKIREGA